MYPWLRLGFSATYQVWIDISVYRPVQCLPFTKYQIGALCRGGDEGIELCHSVKSAMKTA